MLSFKEQVRLNILNKYGTLTKYCELCNISQPALSRSLNNSSSLRSKYMILFKETGVLEAPKPNIIAQDAIEYEVNDV